ncbi:hypothetical protein U0070_022975, partial [Myodes glareolus]
RKRQVLCLPVGLSFCSGSHGAHVCQENFQWGEDQEESQPGISVQQGWALWLDPGYLVATRIIVISNREFITREEAQLRVRVLRGACLACVFEQPNVPCNLRHMERWSTALAGPGGHCLAQPPGFVKTDDHFFFFEILFYRVYDLVKTEGRSCIPRAPYQLMRFREGEAAVAGFCGLSHLDSSELLNGQSWKGRREESIGLQLSYRSDMIRAELQGVWQTQGLEGAAERRRGHAAAAVRPGGGCGRESYFQKTNVGPFTWQHDSPVHDSEPKGCDWKWKGPMRNHDQRLTFRAKLMCTALQDPREAEKTRMSRKKQHTYAVWRDSRDCGHVRSSYEAHTDLELTFRAELRLTYLNWDGPCYQKLIEVNDEYKFSTLYEKSMVTEGLLMLWATKCTWYSERGVLVIDQGELEGGSARLCRCIIDANLSVLKSVVVRKGEKDILGLTDTIVLRMKKAKEQNQEQTAKRHRLASPRGSTSKSESIERKENNTVKVTGMNHWRTVLLSAEGPQVKLLVGHEEKLHALAVLSHCDQEEPCNDFHLL